MALTIPTLAWTSGADSGLGGPSSVGTTLEDDKETKPAIQTVFLDDYFAFKKRLVDTYGFGFGFDYFALIQAASESPGKDTAGGGVFRAYGSWTLTGRDGADTGNLVYKVENRHRLGTAIAPKDLGAEIGYAGITALAFRGDFDDWALTNLYWNQHLFNNRLGFSTGVVDVTDYVDVYGLINLWKNFNNYAFTTSPTIPAPDQDLGAAVRVMPTENVYFIGGIADANGNPTEPEDFFDSFFSDAEYFTHAEVGWISSWDKRFNDNIHLTYWHADEREKAQVSEGWGFSISLSHLFANTWERFLRVGYAKDGGSVYERYVSVGTAYHIGQSNPQLRWDQNLNIC
jgi:porin